MLVNRRNSYWKVDSTTFVRTANKSVVVKLSELQMHVLQVNLLLRS
jgi:hypothetical protein